MFRFREELFVLHEGSVRSCPNDRAAKTSKNSLLLISLVVFYLLGKSADFSRLRQSSLPLFSFLAPQIPARSSHGNPPRPQLPGADTPECDSLAAAFPSSNPHPSKASAAPVYRKKSTSLR